MEFMDTKVLNRQNAPELIDTLCNHHPDFLEWMGFSKEQIKNKDFELYTKAEISERKKIKYIALGKIVKEA